LAKKGFDFDGGAVRQRGQIGGAMSHPTQGRARCASRSRPKNKGGIERVLTVVIWANHPFIRVLPRYKYMLLSAARREGVRAGRGGHRRLLAAGNSKAHGGLCRRFREQNPIWRRGGVGTGRQTFVIDAAACSGGGAEGGYIPSGKGIFAFFGLGTRGPNALLRPPDALGDAPGRIKPPALKSIPPSPRRQESHSARQVERGGRGLRFLFGRYGSGRSVYWRHLAQHICQWMEERCSRRTFSPLPLPHTAARIRQWLAVI